MLEDHSLVRDIRRQRKASSLRRLIPSIDQYPRLQAGLMSAFEENFRYILPMSSVDALGLDINHVGYSIDPFQYEGIWVRLFKQQRKFITYMLMTRRLKSPIIASYKSWLTHITLYQYTQMPEEQMDLYDLLKKDMAVIASDDLAFMETCKRLIPSKYYNITSCYGTPVLNFNFQTTEAEDFRLRTDLIWRDGEHHPRPKPQPLNIKDLF